MIDAQRFALPARILHWLMMPMIVAMLFIGAGMVSTAGDAYALLLAWHRPIGIAVLALVIMRLGVRVTHRHPALPVDMPTFQVVAAKGMHLMLYALMFAMPLLGWAMLSAAGTPITLWPGVILPAILPHDLAVFGWLRKLHGVLGYLFFLTILGHLGAALFHLIVRRDGVMASMAFASTPSGQSAAAVPINDQFTNIANDEEQISEVVTK